MVKNIQTGDRFYIDDGIPVVVVGIEHGYTYRNVDVMMAGNMIMTISEKQLRPVSMTETKKLLRYNKKEYRFDAIKADNKFNPKTNTLFVTAHNDSIIGENQIVLQVNHLHDIQNAVRLITGKEILL